MSSCIWEVISIMDNHAYDLIKALGEKAEAAQVYEIYAKDGVNCDKCSPLWKKLREKEMEDIKEMKQILIDHIKDGVIS